MIGNNKYIKHRIGQLLCKTGLFILCMSAIFLSVSCTQHNKNSSQNYEILVEGSGIMQVGAEDTDNPQTMNLDSINSDDIHFTISEGSGGKFFLFVPINGSVAKRVGATSLGYQGCVQEKSTMTYGYVHDFNTGDYICLITDSGKVSEIKVVRLDSLENLVEISYTTWK
jgi:hypothetical protein